MFTRKFFLLALFSVEILFAQIQLVPPCALNGVYARKVHAVIVGISDYAYNDAINDLSYCHNDAIAFDRFLLTQSAQEGRTGWVDLLINEEATEGNIIHSLEMMNKSATSEDVAIFFFSGHGAVQGLTHYYTRGGDIMEYEGLKAILRACPAKQKIVILDACHAGASSEAIYFGAVSDLVNKEFNKGICLVAASQANQTSEEYEDRKMGYFTNYLLEGLGQFGDLAGNRDGCVSLIEAFEYAKLNVSILSGNEQVPELSGDIPQNLILWQATE